MHIFKAQSGHLFSAVFVLFYNETTCSEVPIAGLLAEKINEEEVKNNGEHKFKRQISPGQRNASLDDGDNGFNHA